MLHIYQSNRLEILGDALAIMLKEAPLNDAFAPEKIIIQSKGMSRWLNFKLAKTNGIAANIDFNLPASFIWQTIRQTIKDAPNESPFSSEAMLWRIFDLLLKLNKKEVFATLNHYLKANNCIQNNAFDLAEKIADVYDQYLIYRADWLLAWEKQQTLNLGRDEAWQARLWLELKHDSFFEHRATLLNKTINNLSAENLPQRLTLFGISSLAPSQLELIKKISNLNDVCLFTLNPCEEYWGDILEQDAEKQTHNHPLLASLGKQGRDFFDAISADDELTSHSLFQEINCDSLLLSLQHDILHLSEPGKRTKSSEEPDESIAIHVAHSELREMEILKDQLLARFAADPSLTPADIAVLTPDIQRYVPFIRAVFNARTDGAPNIPYSIADCEQTQEQPLLLAFCQILELIDSRFLAEDVMSLLECPALCRRFDFSDDDLSIIHHYIKESGIRWAQDAKQREDLGLPSEDSHSWRHGLDRLLLGVMLPTELLNDEQALFANLLPIDSANNAQLLARFASLFDCLSVFSHKWKTPAKATIWVERLNQELLNLFLTDENDLSALTIWQQTLDNLVQQTTIASYQSEFSLSVLRSWLKSRLSMSNESGFLNGGITFCAMIPMRSLPFRQLCLIGLNNEAYPRREKSPSFDLISKHPRRGDRARREDDRYLFLEAIISARQAIYFSYIGRSLRNNEELPPSTLLDELIETLKKMGVDRQQIVTEHPLQAFSQRYYNGEENKLFSFEPTYAFAWQQEKTEPVAFSCKLESKLENQVINWDDFLYFWRLPARYWLKNRLGLSVYETEYEDLNCEAFVLDYFAQNSINQALLNCKIKNHSNITLKQKLSADSDLPNGALGQIYLQEASNLIDRLNLPEEINEEVLPCQSFLLDLDGFKLQGSISNLRASGAYQVTPQKNFTAATKIQIWLQHLLINCLRLEQIKPQTILIDLSCQQKMPILEQYFAQEELKKWLYYWQIGQQQALAFFPKTSLAAASELHNKKSDEEAIFSARKIWSPSFTQGKSFPESKIPALKLAFRAQDALTDELFLNMTKDLLIELLDKLE